MYRVTYQKNFGWQFLCKQCVLEVKNSTHINMGVHGKNK